MAVIKKSGKLIGVTVCTDNGRPWAGIYVEFPEGRHVHMANREEEPSAALDMLISKYDLAVRDTGTLFAYFDSDRMFAFQCAVWYKDKFLLKEAVRILPDDMQDYVFGIFAGAEPNVASGDRLEIFDRNRSRDDFMPSAYYSADDEMTPNPVMWKNFRDTVYSQSIGVASYKVVEFTNSWLEESISGEKVAGQSQCYGGIVRLDSGFCNDGEKFYDYDAETVMCREANHLIWDANTCIELKGNRATWMRVLCSLKNIGIFKPWTDSMDFFKTGLINDIRILAGDKYMDKWNDHRTIRIDLLLEEIRRQEECRRKHTEKIRSMCIPMIQASS